METPKGITSERPSRETSERNRIVEQVYRKYHEDLMRWCKHKFQKIHFRSDNPKRDAEEIIADLYEKLLTDKKPIDLTRSDADIRGFLNIALNYAIGSFDRRRAAKKRNPEGGEESLISLEKTLGEGGEENLALPLDSEGNDEREERDAAIDVEGNEEQEKRDAAIDVEQALTRLGEKNKRLAGIMKQRHLLGKTLQEVGDSYGVTRERIRQLEERALEKMRNSQKKAKKSN